MLPVLLALMEIVQVTPKLFRLMSRGITAGSRSHTSAQPGSIAVKSAELFFCRESRISLRIIASRIRSQKH
jgi:hypothetical protein